MSLLKGIWVYLCQRSREMTLTGIGTLLLGIAALVATCQTNEILSKILKIQNQAKGIEKAVKSLEYEIKGLAAYRKVESSALKESSATLDQIRGSIIQIPSEQQPGAVYLPKDRRERVIQEMLEAVPSQRGFILQQNLEYSEPNQ